MHSAKDILKAMGFNDAAPDSTKEAFFKNLQRAAQEHQKAEVIEGTFGTTTNRANQGLEKSPEARQLSFDAEILGPKTTVKLKVGS